MSDEKVEKKGGKDVIQPGSLREAVETLRGRFSSIRVETLVAENDTALSVHFLGDGTNMQERQLIVSSLAQSLPPALSVLGIKPEEKQSSKVATSVNGTC